MGKLELEVVTPEKILISQVVDIVIAPGSVGEFGVLESHVPFLTGIVPGELRFTSGSEKKSFAVTSGFAEVSNNKVSVLVDAAEEAGEIDTGRAQKAMERAKERLGKDRSAEEIDFLRAEIAMKRAIARIKVAEKSN